MPISGAYFDILGLTISRCGPVEGLLHLPLDGGLTALYGLNGAGKTQCLTLLREALVNAPLSGRRERGFVDIHVQLRPPPSASTRHNWRNSSAHGFLTDLRDNMRSLVEERIDRLASNNEVDQRAFNPLALESAIPALLEACEERRLTFRTCRDKDGSVSGYAVDPAVSPNSPAGAAFLAEAERIFRERRPTNGEIQQRLTPPLARVDYWGSDTDPHWIQDVPRTLQVPLDWHLGGTPTGFKLALVGGDLARPFDPDEATQSELALECDFHGIDYYQPGSDSLSEDLRLDVIDEWEGRANRFLQSVLAPAPNVFWTVPSPTDLALGSRPRWEFDEGWPLSQASGAQRRWIQFALEASMPRGEEPFILLLDEPEAGLHRLAEHRIGSGLHSWTTQGGADAVVVATHSPDLLSSPVTETLLVSRSAHSGVTLRQVQVSLAGDGGRSAAGELGLAVGDLWAMSRLVVVVEGIHDQWVFEALLRSELDGSVAAVLPMHGGTRLRSLAEARLLMDGTDAAILVVLDDLDAHAGESALEQIQLAACADNPDELTRALEDLRLRGRKNDSMLFLHQFLARAAELGDLGRVQIHGLSLPDVICYLDPDTVLLEPRDWAVLLKAWSDEAAPNTPKNLKGWLRRERLLADSPTLVDQAVEQAAMRMSDERRHLHPDLAALGMKIAEMGAHRR